MKKASLKLQSYGSNVNIIDNGNLQKRILNSMLASFAFLAFMYFLLLGSMIFNIIERRTLESHANLLTNEVAGLELEYLSLSSDLDLNMAESLGLKETKAKYVTRKSLGSISMAKNEI